jgi:hypothetical protein
VPANIFYTFHIGPGPENELQVNTCKDRAIAQTVIRRILTAEIRVRAWSVGFAVGKVAPGQAFSPSPLLFPRHYHSTDATYSLMYQLGDGRPQFHTVSLTPS